MSKSSPPQPKIRNKKALKRYEILDRIECGLVLTGTEVKSLRQARASLDEAFARITDGEVWLFGCHIATYDHGNVQNHEPLRRRKIARLGPKVFQKGLTLVPLDIYFSERGLAKVTLALVRGKSHHDKRQDLKKREDRREMDRALRRR